MVSAGDVVCLKCGGVNRHEPDCRQRDEEFEVLSAYGRCQAIEDGALIDCTQPPFGELNRQAGITAGVAMTAEAFHICVHPLGTSRDSGWIELEDADHPQLPAGQDIKGRYWDVISMLRFAIRKQAEASTLLFRLYVVPSNGGNAELVELKCVAGPDDAGEVCLTIMLPDQD